eukprot:CAMPEP_0177617860 /NCGR_PEP_ID=MMETSP0419_2-20121207/25184_1 /TAXON_ID=582737 /ORGANISM="Tetraselmis sp., Strain GSL018" /LENGTH=151 /DNA_ID=CAMNT_0019116553 /DNA_START=209 /DNA_END=661 /DNA_ORIENTATION=-
MSSKQVRSKPRSTFKLGQQDHICLASLPAPCLTVQVDLHLGNLNTVEDRLLALAETTSNFVFWPSEVRIVWPVTNECPVKFSLLFRAFTMEIVDKAHNCASALPEHPSELCWLAQFAPICKIQGHDTSKSKRSLDDIFRDLKPSKQVENRI